MHVVNAFTGCQDEARINAGTSSKPARHSKLYIPFLEMIEYVNFYLASKLVTVLIFQSLNTCHLGKISFYEDKHDWFVFLFTGSNS